VNLVLEPNSPELIRSGYVQGSANAQAVLDFLFPSTDGAGAPGSGRLLRAYDPSTGEEQYSVIQSTNATAAAGPTVTLVPTLPFVGKDTQPTCGLRGSASSLRINTVNIIRYGLANLGVSGDPNYGFLSDNLTQNGQRLEFVREEIDPAAPDASLAAGAGTISGTTELVAEFAVDFRVDLVAVTNTTATPPTKMFLNSSDAQFVFYAGDPTNTGEAAGLNRGPHLIRALHPRLAVRERIASRDANVDASAPPGLFRVALTNPGTANAKDFAKVRTLQSYIMTRNARNVLW
jgi:hypothetical protein